MTKKIEINCLSRGQITDWKVPGRHVPTLLQKTGRVSRC
jgi:hypothetical protein